MARSSLGVTATELFACNPYRVLGVAVDTPAKQIHEVYLKLTAMAAVGETDNYKTNFDFDFLPPFTRTEKDLKTAYGKLVPVFVKKSRLGKGAAVVNTNQITHHRSPCP